LKETKDKIGELMKRFSNLESATNNLAMGGDFNYNTMPVTGAANGASRNMGQTVSDSKMKS
jgi:hypothetical protein